MGQMETYTEYKDTNVKWLGEVPNHWNLKKLKYLASIVTGNTPPKSNEENYNDGIYPWVKPGNLNFDYTISNTKEKLSKKGIELARVIPKKSALVSSIGTVGKVAINNEPVTTNQQINSIVFDKDEWIAEYGVYAVIAAEQEFKRYANKVVISILNKTSQENIFMPLPSRKEQKTIGTFINHKTSEIDALIADKEKLIKLLEEKRQAIITEAVTKGLDPDVKMKASGVEWIGVIPEHWNKTKIKYTTYVKGRIGWQGLKSDEFIDQGPYLVTGTDFKDGRVHWDSCHHISEERYEEAKPIQLQENDLLITKDGTIGKVALVKNKPEKAILNSGIFVTRSLKGEYINEYMYWILLSDIFKNYVNYMETGSTIKHLYQETFINFLYPMPSIQEQKEINQFLQEYINELNSLVKKVYTQISKLKEYRQSIIYEAVTGKIDVPAMVKETEQEEVLS